MIYPRSARGRLAVALVIVVLVSSLCWSNSSVINGGKNDFESNIMLRDSSGKGEVNSTQPHRSVVIVGDKDIDDKDSNQLLMTANKQGGEQASYRTNCNDNIYDNRDPKDISISNSENNEDILLPLNDQVRLLTKQLNALMLRRREDYELLENNLRKSLLISNTADNEDVSIRAELDQLRREIKLLREGHIGGNKEKLTVEWLTQSIAEIRKELSELQDIASKASKDINQRTQHFEDLATIKSDFHRIKLELEALKERQQTTEVFVKELREDSIQREEDLRRILLTRNSDQNRKIPDNEDPIQLSTDAEADHKRRHHRIQRQQLHDLEVAQRDVKRQLNELQYHRISERVRNLEIEQHRIAGANFNLSRQIASLDKLHSSMLELLEDIEGIQNKMDKTLPDVRREISKLEFTTAQLNSEQSLIREEGQNVARSVQAMAVSVSALQEERDTVKDMQNQIDTLRKDVKRLQSITEIQKSIVRRRMEKMEMEAKRKAMLDLDGQIVNKTDPSARLMVDDDNVNNSNGSDNKRQQHSVENIEKAAQNLVEKLESVELQYESIINKLPNDCSQVEMASSSSGLYLIAPAGQNKPIVAHCSGTWTTIQRRFDGSVDFNRSWEAYAAGFGTPAAEYWIGNEMLHHLTNDNCTELKVVMQDIYDNTWHAQYKSFYISSREDGYRLHVSGYSGNASDALDYQNDMQFSAIDVDRDISNTHCAANYEGGWWFSHCQHANLNGRYNLGLTWFDASLNEWIAVKSSQMLITKRQSCTLDTVHRINHDSYTNLDSSLGVMVQAEAAGSGLISVIPASTSHNANDEKPLTIVSGMALQNKTPKPVTFSKVRTTTTIASVV